MSKILNCLQQNGTSVVFKRAKMTSSCTSAMPGLGFAGGSPPHAVGWALTSLGKVLRPVKLTARLSKRNVQRLMRYCSCGHGAS